MLVIVAVEAEQFPVAAVGWIVVMVVVPVVDRQLAKLLAFEFPDASGADMREKLQGFFAVSGLAQLLLLAHLCNSLVVSFVPRFGHKIPFNSLFAGSLSPVYYNSCDP